MFNKIRKIFFIVPIVFLVLLILSVSHTKSLGKKISECQVDLLKYQEASSPLSDAPIVEINSWKEFSDPQYVFSFKYPSDWYLEEIEDGIRVANYPDSCTQCSNEEKNNYYSFYIARVFTLKGENNTSDSYTYVLTRMLEYYEKIQHQSDEERIKWYLNNYLVTFKGGGFLINPDHSILATEIVPQLWTPPYLKVKEGSVELFRLYNVNLSHREYLFIKENKIYIFGIVESTIKWGTTPAVNGILNSLIIK